MESCALPELRSLAGLPSGLWLCLTPRVWGRRWAKGLVLLSEAGAPCPASCIIADLFRVSLSAGESSVWQGRSSNSPSLLLWMAALTPLP